LFPSLFAGTTTRRNKTDASSTVRRIGSKLYIQGNKELINFNGLPALACVNDGSTTDLGAGCSDAFKTRITAAASAWNTSTCQ